MFSYAPLIFLFGIGFVSAVDEPCPRPKVLPEMACVPKNRCSDANAKPCYRDSEYVLCPANTTRNASIFEKKCYEWSTMVKTCEEDPGFFSNYYEEDHCNVGNPLVFHGRDALLKEYPFMALIGYGRGHEVKWQCGGTLISELWVMSAAHCTYNRNLRLPAAWVLLGDLIVGDSDEAKADGATPQYLRIKERHNYEEYSDRMRYHDIALYKLQRPAQLSPAVRPACLHVTSTHDVNDLIILGWGATEKVAASPHLQAAKVPLVEANECNRRVFENNRFAEFPSGLQDNKMLCAGGILGKDTCVGDSGGPAVAPSGLYCTQSVVGVTSVGLSKGEAVSSALFSDICGQNVPAIYTRVSYYKDWIQSLVWP